VLLILELGAKLVFLFNGIMKLILQVTKVILLLQYRPILLLHIGLKLSYLLLEFLELLLIGAHTLIHRVSGVQLARCYSGVRIADHVIGLGALGWRQ
jgi:hypothetical protein